MWSPRLGQVELPSAAAIATAASRAPVRYVLDDDVAALAMTTALGDSAQLAACIDLIRIPAPDLWIEWNERGALHALRALGLIDAADVRMAHIGLHVRADESGRRGEISIAWDGGGPSPDLSPFVVEFDLDDPGLSKRPLAGEIVRGVETPEDENLSRLLMHVRYRLRPEWRAYLERETVTSAQREAAVYHNLDRAFGDFPFLAAFCLVLSARSALDLNPVSLDRLNAARAKRNKAPLLDHIEVSARLDAHAVTPTQGAFTTRAEARLHFVCGHLVRRRGRIFWRRAHLRGSAKRGLLALRTINVRAPLHAPAPMPMRVAI